MLDKLVIDTLKTAFDLEIANSVIMSKESIIVKLEDGNIVKITTKKVV